MTDLTPLVQAIIAVVAALITAFVIPYIKSKTSKEQQLEMETWVNIAVLAAEQLYFGSGRGEEKRDYVLNFLKDRGYEIDVNIMSDSINALIEAAVYDLKN